MEFYVYSRQKAKSESYRLKVPTLIISITDPFGSLNTFAQNRNIVSICRVQFDDVTRENAGPDDILMRVQDAQKIRDYVRAYADKVECIIVHCEAGISRSAGVMAAIQKYLLGDDSEIFNSNLYLPNEHCYRLMTSAFDGYF